MRYECGRLHKTSQALAREATQQLMKKVLGHGFSTM